MPMSSVWRFGITSASSRGFLRLERVDHRLEVIVAEPLTHVQNFSALKWLGNEYAARGTPFWIDLVRRHVEKRHVWPLFAKALVGTV
jgi:hypothetical protein